VILVKLAVVWFFIQHARQNVLIMEHRNAVWKLIMFSGAWRWSLCVGFTAILILCIAVAVGLIIFIAGMCIIQKLERFYPTANILDSFFRQRAAILKDDTLYTRDIVMNIICTL